METIKLERSSTSRRNMKQITVPSNPRPQNHLHQASSTTYTSGLSADDTSVKDKPLVARRNYSPLSRLSRTRAAFSSTIRSLLNMISLPTVAVPTCRWFSIPNHLSVSPSASRKVTGTLFGHRKGHVSFAVQFNPRSEPVLLIELATSTSALVQEMSSGLVRIALECEKGLPPATTARGRPVRLFQEPVWTMYCNGRKCGYATSRACSEFDWYVLSTIQTVSVGAGVIPLVVDGKSGGGAAEGELLYMRARFERVVGSRDSEAFYMLNPDGRGATQQCMGLGETRWWLASTTS
ncbi:hypothetical protein Ancab_013840 [Ancistrocladus abbreviatus]